MNGQDSTEQHRKQRNTQISAHNTS